MDGWLTGMLLPPVLPSDLAVLVPENQKPTRPGLCQADLIRVPKNAVLETRHHRFACLQGKAVPLWSPFPGLCLVFLHSVTFIDNLAPGTARNPLWLLNTQHTIEPWKGREFWTLPGERCYSLRALRQDALPDLRWSTSQSVQVQPAL